MGLFIISITNSNNQFHGLFSFIILALLVTTIVVQLYSLNMALHYHLPVFVIPVFYTLFTILSLSNSVVYLDQISVYTPLQFFFLVFGIGVLVSGVWVLRKGHIAAAQAELDDSIILLDGRL